MSILGWSIEYKNIFLGKYKKFVQGETFWEKYKNFFQGVFFFFQAWAGNCPRLLHFPLLITLLPSQCFKRLSYFYEFKSYGLQTYIFQLILQQTYSYNTRNFEEHIIAERTYLKTPFFHGPFVSGINLIQMFVNLLTLHLDSIYFQVI